MNSGMIKFKKFLSNRNTVAIICAILGILVLYFGYTMKVQDAVKPVTIPYAKVTIQPRTKITKEMIGYMTIAQAALDEMNDTIIKNTKDLIDYYSNTNTMIPEGSFFYKSAVVKEEDIAGSALLGINSETEMLYILNVNMSTSYVKSILPGGYVDLYVRTTDEFNKARVGRFIKNVRVLAVKTSDGLNVFENSDEMRVPAYVFIAVTHEQHHYLVTAAELGINVFPVPTSISEKEVVDSKSEKVITSEEIIDYIEDASERFEQVVENNNNDNNNDNNSDNNNENNNDENNNDNNNNNENNTTNNPENNPINIPGF